MGHQLTAVGGINKEERGKYKNCNNLSPKDQLKYAPKESRFTTGKGTRRELGESVWGNEGLELYTSIKKIWKSALDNQ